MSAGEEEGINGYAVCIVDNELPVDEFFRALAEKNGGSFMYCWMLTLSGALEVLNALANEFTEAFVIEL